MSEIRERLEREWRYIAESPRPIFGGFHDRVIEVAKDSLKFLASLPSALRSRESVEIDYDTEIATFDFIVSAIDTDHGYDIDKAKAAVWLRQFSERVRGRESATITKLPFNCPECGYAIHDEDDAALHLIRYGPKCGQAFSREGAGGKIDR